MKIVRYVDGVRIFRITARMKNRRISICRPDADHVTVITKLLTEEKEVFVTQITYSNEAIGALLELLDCANQISPVKPHNGWPNCMMGVLSTPNTLKGC